MGTLSVVTIRLVGPMYFIMVEWSYTIMVNGVEYVVMDGIMLMLMWCVDNWDLDHHHTEQLILDKDQDPSG